jgi:hypothetical protein
VGVSRHLKAQKKVSRRKTAAAKANAKENAKAVRIARSALQRASQKVPQASDTGEAKMAEAPCLC